MAVARFTALLALGLIAAAMLNTARACPFANMRRQRLLQEGEGVNVMSKEEYHSLIAGHRRIAQETASGYKLTPPIPDLLGNALPIPSVSVGTYPYEIVDVFAGISKATKRDMCYAVAQILPVPPLGFNTTAYETGGDPCPPGQCRWDTDAIDQTKALAVAALATLAVDRWNKMVDDKRQKGPIVYGTVSAGGMIRKRLCSIGYGMKEGLCDAKVFRDKFVQVSTAFTIVKITPDNADDVKHAINTWRTTKTGHLPNIRSDIVAKGFGYTGVEDFAFNGKLVPCDLVPRKFWYKKSGFEDRNPSTGRLYASEAMEWWSTACQAFFLPGIFDAWGPQTCPPPPKKP